MGKAPDKIQYIALYASKAYSGATPSIYANYIGNSTLEDAVIADWLTKGHNLVYLTNTNLISSGGFMGTQYTTTGKANLKVFIRKCRSFGIYVGVVGGIAYSTGPNYGDAAYNSGPALRVVNYNSGAAFDEKITHFLIEEEYWRAIAGNMNFTQFLAACQAVYNILHPAGVSNDVYIVRDAVGDLAAMAPYIDIFWMTTYLYAPRDNQPRYDAIHSWVVELAATLPTVPIKVGALISLESYSYNKTGGNDSASNFDGYWIEGKRIGAPLVSSPPVITSPKNYNQASDKITHNGTVGLPPIDFNSEPTSVTDYINWMGIQVFDYDLAPHMNILDANTNEVYALGDGSPQDAVEYAVAQQVANLIPYNAARFLYLGDVYNAGTQAEYIGTPRSYDTLYGTQSSHNLLILTSATMGSREWANRAVGYDPYWSGALAGVGTVQPVWDGDRTITNPHYYSFYLPADDGTLWKFVCLNTMEDGFAGGGVTVGSPMYNWFVNEMNDTSVGRRKIVFCHHPRFSSDATYGDNANMQPVWAAMQNKAMILLSGRVHNYQRMEMRDSSGAVVAGGGVYQVISGTGGTATFGFAASYLAGAIGYRIAENGVTRLTLYNDRVDVCFINNNGVVRDCSSLLVATTIPPIVNAGPDQAITLPATATMAGTATDTNTPSLTLVNIWTKISGAGTVTFANANSLTTSVSFSSAGTYVLRLTSNNGVNSSFDEMTVTVTAAAASKTFLVQSSGVTGVPIIVSITDVNGNTSGNTNFSRTYLTAQNPVLTAPSTFGSYYFIKWTKDGVDFTFGTALTTADLVDRTFVAVYDLTPNISYAVLINSSPSSGVAIGTTISGATPQSGYVTGGDTLSLSAPATFGGRAFVRWTKDGVLLTTSRITTTVVTTDATYTAVYAPLAGEFAAICYIDYGATYFDPVRLIFEGSADSFLTVSPSTNSNSLSWELNTLTGVPVQLFIECGLTYAAVAIDGSGNLFLTTFNVPFKALPSAEVQIVQPTVIGGTGQYTIVSPSTTSPYDAPPLGRGVAAGIQYTSAASLAGSYSHVVGLTAIESAILTNLVIDGDLQSDPLALAVPWTATGGTSYNASQETLDIPASTASVITIPITTSTAPVSTVRWFVMVWVGDESGSPITAADVQLYYNGVSIASIGNNITQCLTAVITPTGVLKTFQVRSFGAYANIISVYRVVVYEYDVTFNATLVDPAALNAVDTITNVTCNGGANGSISLVVTGGTAPYSYAWTKTGAPTNVYPNSNVLTALDAGTYNVTITDINGDTLSDSYIVTAPAAIVPNITVTNVTCNGAGNGIVTFAPTGGTAPYTYIIDGVIRTIPAAGIATGSHLYIVTDANGCSVSGSFSVTEPTELTSTLAITNVACYGGTSGQVIVTPAGGTAPYQYSFDGGAYSGTATKTGLSAGAHTVIVKDANNCLDSTDYAITQPSDIVITKTVTNPSSVGASDGAIGIAITGGTYPIVTTWADGTVFTLSSSGSFIYGGLQQGTYTAVAVDANGCTKNISQALVDTPNEPPVDPPNDVDVDRFSILANCCLGDKIFDLFKQYEKGHVQLDCLAYPVFLLNEKVQLLRKWYTLGQTLGGAKGIFVFTVQTTFNLRTIIVSLVGLPTVTYVGDSNISYSLNMAAFIAALTTAGYDVEYESDSGLIFMYSPMNSFYNGVIPSVKSTFVAGGTRNSVISTTGFMGAVTPCVTSEKFTPNCLDVDDKNLLIEQIRIACNSCLCGDYKVKDTI